MEESPKKNEPMKISAPYFLYNQEFWNIQFPRKNDGQTLTVRIQNQQKGLLVFRLEIDCHLGTINHPTKLHTQ